MKYTLLSLSLLLSSCTTVCQLQKPSVNYDVRKVSGDSSLINKSLSGKLSGYGSVFVEAGKKYRVDPIFLAAVAMHETGNGNSKAIRYKKNAMGIYDGRARRTKEFKSIKDSIFEGARIIAGKNYYEKGRYTVAQIQKVYCPVGASNDSGGLNRYWLTGVVDNIKEIEYGNL